MGHTCSWQWLTVDVLDDGELVSCNGSLQPNKISYKSQRKALWRRHPIPPSFQLSSTRHAGIKEAGSRGRESKQNWDVWWNDGGHKKVAGRDESMKYCKQDAERDGKAMRVKGICLSSLLSILSLFPSGDVVVIYSSLCSPAGMGGKWALNWVSIHHLLTLMLVVLECLHLMFLS